MADIPFTRRWVATRASSRRAARAALWLGLRHRAWRFALVLEAVFALLLYLLFTSLAGLDRVKVSVAFALVPTLAVLTLLVLQNYLVTRVQFRRRLRPGVVLESGFGDDAVALRGPWADVTLRFDGIAWVRRAGGWVFLQQKGAPVPAVWPAQLFGTDDLDRLQRHVAGRPSVRSEPGDT